MFLGIDLGTSAVKALLADTAGRIIASGESSLQVSRPQPHWSEQSPEMWWQSTLKAVSRLQQHHRHELAAVRGIGLSGQMHGATLLDRTDRPLRPAILWNDTRSSRQCAQLMARAPSLTRIAGNLVMPGFTAPKLLWVAEHEPEIFKRTVSVLLPKDYLRLRMTGEKMSDMSDASGTLWLNVEARAWSDELLAATGLTMAQVPALVEGSVFAGQLRKGLAESWGIRHSVTVAGGAGDNAASAIGIGAVSPGDGFVSLGTSGVVFAVSDQFLPYPQSAVHTFCHALPGRWHHMSVMLSAASCLHWAVKLTGAGDEQTLLDEIASIDDTMRYRAPIFLPYLSGERTPYNDPDAKGVFFGLTHDTTRAVLGYSVLEGVAFGLADGWAALQHAGATIKSVSLVGGGARSTYWGQLLATILSTRIHVREGGEAGAALGAARLAHLAYGGEEAEVCRKQPNETEFVPQPQLAPMFDERLQRFRTLYTTNKSLFKSQAA